MENILLLISLVQKTYGKWLFHRLLLRILVIIGLIIVIALMMSATFVAGLCAAYYFLLSYGIEQSVVILLTGILAIMLIISLIIITIICLHKLRNMPQTMLKSSPVTALAMDTLNSFTNGLMAEQGKKSNEHPKKISV